MKKSAITIIVFVLMVSLLAPKTVKADVIWEPRVNFFEDNGLAYSIEQRAYVVNSPDGFINVYSSPDSAITVSQLKNGETFFVYYKAEYNGKIWGMNTAENYIVLDNTYVAYDHISFEEDFKDSFTQPERTYDIQGGTVYAEYPGAARHSVFPESFNAKEAYPMYSFIDENGKEWLYFGYVYGMRNFWICADDPKNEDYEVRKIETPALYTPEEEPSRELIKEIAKEETGGGMVGSRKGIMIVVACICCFAVVAVAAYLITKRVKSDDDEE